MAIRFSKQLPAYGFAAWGLAVLLSIPAPAPADDFEWSVPFDGFFISPGPWTRLTGTSSAPPGAGDTAIFNEAGAYTATFTNNRTTEDLDVFDGEVTFRSSGTDRTYTLTDDLRLIGGDLTLGVAGDPLDLSVADQVQIGGVSLLEVLHGSEVDVNGQLRVGANTSGNGAVIVNNSRLTTSAANATVIGAFGSTGTMTLSNSAVAEIGSDLNVGASGVTGSSGSVSLSGGSKLDVAGDINMVTGNNTNQSGFFDVGASTVNLMGNLSVGTGTSTNQSAFLSVTGASAVFNQVGAGTIDVGGAAGVGRFARLDINGGAFTSGTGQITVHETGVLDTAAGSFTANGPVVVNNGGSLVIEQGDFEAKAGLDNSAGGAIDHRDGTLTVSGGHFQATPDIVGTEEFTVSGAAAGDRPMLLLKSGATADVTLALNIGVDGMDGDMRIESGAELTHTIARLARSAGSDVDVVVTGEGSLWRAIRGFGFALFEVGGSGTAEVQVLDGGELYTGGGQLGRFSTGEGTIRVNNGVWTSTSHVEVGGAGTGLLDITQGSTVQIQQDLEIGTTNNGSSRGDVLVRFDSTLTARDVGVGGTTTAAGGTGRLYLEDGTTRFSGEVKVWPGGEMEIGAAGVFSSQPFVAAAEIDSSLGGTFLFNRGTLQVESFIGNLSNPDGTLAPGPDLFAGSGAGATAISGNYTQGNDARLDIEIGGDTPGAQYDLVTVAGVASIDGYLDFSLLGNFEPDGSDTFTILSATTLNGFFNNVFTGQRRFTTGGEGSFVVNYGVGSAFPANQVVLSDFVPASIPGDFNGDGVVDAADYTVWRDNLGTSVALPGDTSPGSVTSSDYNTWRNNYGATAASAAIAPEPATFALVLMGLGASSRRWRSSLIGSRCRSGCA